jgi:hypothetical protein
MFVCNHGYLTIKIIVFHSLLATTMLFAFSEFHSTTAFLFNRLIRQPLKMTIG